jgi:uncharacterized protein involved in response to NO
LLVRTVVNHRSLLLDDVSSRSQQRQPLALASKGFRPFFLLASAYAVAIVPLWIAMVSGLARPPTVYLDAVTWHAHEMIFGYTAAVIAGFLLTAVGNWTKRETATGVPLLALAALWVLGRVAMAGAAVLPRGAAAIVDGTFLPALVVVLARPLVAARNRRNFVMLAIVGVLAAANVAVHLDALGVAGDVVGGLARRASLVGVDVVVLVILVMAGRVFPMFTRNATGVTSIRSLPVLDALTIATMAVVVAVDAFAPERTNGLVSATAAGVVGVLSAARAAFWGGRHALRTPLLWILHVGYAWVPIGLVLRAVAAFDGSVPRSLATHALTAGAIGSLTLGMMARVALGHAGRPLVAPKLAIVAFVSITVAAITRVFVPLLAPSSYLAALWISAAAWATAFLSYLVAYAPMLASRH